jgi:hypothetical protein
MKGELASRGPEGDPIAAAAQAMAEATADAQQAMSAASAEKSHATEAALAERTKSVLVSEPRSSSFSRWSNTSNTRSAWSVHAPMT